MKKGRTTKKKKKDRKKNAGLEDLRPFWDQGKVDTVASKEDDRKKRRRSWPSFKM